MYKQTIPMFGQTEPTSVIRTTDGACIPFAPDNTDYQTFKKEVLAGAELQDADGNPIADPQAYIAALP
jgi:hypothetical protein